MTAMTYTSREMMAVAAAREIQDGEIVPPALVLALIVLTTLPELLKLTAMVWSAVTLVNV